MKTEISVVIPLFNCADALNELYKRLLKVLSELDVPYEIIFVNDGSLQNDWQIVKSLSAINPSVKGISFDNNYGQYNAIACGIKNATGKWIVIMDGDLQDNPEDIEKLYQKANEGFDLVFAVRTGRDEGFFNKIGSWIYKILLSHVLGVRLNHKIANFSILKKDFINEVLKFSDAYIKFLPSLMLFKNIRSAQINVKHSKRYAGKSSYNFLRKYKLGLEIAFSFARKRIEQFFKLTFYINLHFLFFVILSLFFIHPFTIPKYVIIIFLIFLNLSIMFISANGMRTINNMKNIKKNTVYNISETINIEILNN